MSESNLPKVVSRDEWLVARKELLISEKEAIRVSSVHRWDAKDGQEIADQNAGLLPESCAITTIVGFRLRPGAPLPLPCHCVCNPWISLASPSQKI